MDIAIVAVAYNRVDSLTRLLNSLDCAYYGDDRPTLIISVDKSKTDVVELFADSYVWKQGRKIVDKHQKNLGLRQHMMSLGKWFDVFDAIVVLEDDIVVSPNFYTFTKQTAIKYSACADIAGISLYAFSINYQQWLPFDPVKDEHDAYFMQCAMSWGEVWLRDSWRKYYEWYLGHQEFPVSPNLPYTICSWNEKSWLKYHTRYCIEEGKFFVYPYASLTTNYGDAGEHSNGYFNTLYQVAFQLGEKKDYYLPVLGESGICYDGFFENISLYSNLDLNEDYLCLDLYGERNNRLKKRYWLTCEIANYKIVRSFGLNYRPIEVNVLVNNPGNRIFLYDTSVVEKNTNRKHRGLLLYHFRLTNVFFFVRRYGFVNALKDLKLAIKNKFGLK